MSLFEFIVSAENLRRRKTSLVKEERDVTSPIIQDSSQMGEIYGIYADEAAKRNIKLDSLESRRIFIFIILRLWYPSFFLGYRLREGRRDMIAETLGVEASIISHDMKNLIFYYKKYRSFRETVDSIYDAVMGLLSEK